MKNQLVSDLKNYKNKLAKNIIEAEDALSIINKISNLENEIMDEIIKIKILKHRLSPNSLLYNIMDNELKDKIIKIKILKHRLLDNSSIYNILNMFMSIEEIKEAINKLTSEEILLLEKSIGMTKIESSHVSLVEIIIRNIKDLEICDDMCDITPHPHHI